MANGSTISINTQLLMNDSQFQANAKKVEQQLRKLSTSQAFVKLRLDDSDWRKSIQSLVVEAQKEIRRAFGAKLGQEITYRNSKGNSIKIDTEKSMIKAQQYALEQSVNPALSKADQNMWSKRSAALETYLGYLKQVRDVTKDVIRTQNAVKSGRIMSIRQQTASSMNEEARAAKKILELEKAIAKERTRHSRGGGQWVSSLYKQINMYHDLESAAKKAGQAQTVQYARTQITALNQQADALERVNNLFGKQGKIVNGLRSVMARYLSIYMIADFGKKIAETTGYFQQQQVALEGILGSASKATSVLNEIKDFAIRSPFQTKELVTFTKQLAAFGVGNNDLFPTVKKLADISAGLGVDMSRIILAYGQVKSAAVLRGQELRQFTEAGIPMVQALADKFTELNGKLVTTADVFKLISERKVPFEMVASVLSDMTAEGGRFYNMQENITETLYGQIQKLKDLWTLALDKMGRGSGSFIIKIVKGLQNAIKNIQVIGNLGAFAVLGRGIGKAAEGVSLLIRRFKALGATALFTKGALTGAIGVIGAVVGFAVGGIKSLIDKHKELDRKMKEVADSYAKDAAKMTMGIDSLAQKINSASIGTKRYNDAVSALASNYSQFVSTGMIEALRGQKDAASAAADEFLRLSESIKETIRQSKLYESQEAQAKAAASAAAAGTGENVESSPWYKPEKGNLLQTSKLTRYVQGAPQYERSYLAGVKEYATTKGISAESLITPISNIIQDAIEEAAAEGFDNKTDKGLHKIKALFAKRIGEAYKFDAKTIGAIVNNAVDSADWEKYQVAIEKYAAAAATTFGKIKKPFDAFDKKVSSGRYAESANADKIEKEVNKELEVLVALRRAMKAADIKTYAGSDLEKLINGAKPEDNEFAYKIVQGIDKFREGRTDEEKALLYQISQMFSERVGVRSDRAARVTAAFRNQGSQVYKWRDDDDLQNIVATYGNPNNANVEKLREQLGTDKSELQSKRERSRDEKERALLLKQIEALTVLQGASLYAMGDKPKKGGGGAGGGGWQRFLADLFSYIKEARAEEKKLVEHSAGLTEDLANQINSDQLQGTAVDAFWESMQKGGSPFKKIIDKMDEYGIESTFFDKDFLKGALSDIVTQSIKSTGTVDFQNVWNQLIQVINKRADELLKNTSTKKLGESIKAYAQQATVEGEKYFGRDAVQKLIEDQLKELRKINGQFENIRSTQNAISSIRGASNAYRAYGALGSRGYTSSAEVTRQQLSALLGAKGGQGLSMATPLAQLINGGSLGINSISQILAIKESLAGITTKDMQGDDEAARQANFDEFKGVLGQFDSLLGQLTNDILEDFKRIMAARDPFMKAGDDIVNAFDEYSKTIALIAHGLANGDIDKSRRDGMMVQATQNLYTAVAKSMGGDGMPEYINRLFPEFGTATGTSNRGFELGMWLGNGSLTNKIANYEAKKAGLNPDDYDTEKEFLEAVDKAANGVLKFAAKMELASAIVQKVDSYIQKSAQFANKLIDALDANNGLVKDEYGNYTYENDYSTAKEAINMISEFSSGISSAFQSLLSGDIFGAITGIGTAIAGFFENLFGIGDSQIQKQQDKIISANKSLERAMTNLQHTLQDVAGKDKWDNLTNQIANLREQQSNNKELENLEVSKKHGDADKAESFRSASEEAMREAENTIRQIREEVLGVADDIAGQFTDAFTEAFRNGENLARAWRDSVRSYIADTLKDVLLKSVVAPRINDIFKKFGIEEGKTSSSDIIAMMSDPTKMKEFRNDLFAEGTFLQDWLTGLPKEIQEMIGYNGSTSELSGGIQGITEDTARTLEGLSNSILAQHVITNRYLSDMAVSGFAQVQLSWFTDMQNLQRQIASNTRTVSDVLTGSRDGIRSLQVRIE